MWWLLALAAAHPSPHTMLCPLLVAAASSYIGAIVEEARDVHVSRRGLNLERERVVAPLFTRRDKRRID